MSAVLGLGIFSTMFYVTYTDFLKPGLASHLPTTICSHLTSSCSQHFLEISGGMEGQQLNDAPSPVQHSVETYPTKLPKSASNLKPTDSTNPVELTTPNEKPTVATYPGKDSLVATSHVNIIAETVPTQQRDTAFPTKPTDSTPPAKDTNATFSTRLNKTKPAISANMHVNPFSLYESNVTRINESRLRVGELWVGRTLEPLFVDMRPHTYQVFL